MEQQDILPGRIRWLVVATGIVTSGLFFFGLFNLAPFLLVLGAILQSYLPRPGRWLIWLGAAELSQLLVSLDVLWLRSRSPYPDHILYSFISLLLISTVLIAWSDAELIAEAVQRTRGQRSVSRTRPRALSRAEWIFAIILNLCILYGAVGGLVGYHRSGNRYMGASSLAWVLLVAIMDTYLIRESIKTRRVRSARS